MSDSDVSSSAASTDSGSMSSTDSTPVSDPTPTFSESPAVSATPPLSDTPATNATFHETAPVPEIASPFQSQPVSETPAVESSFAPELSGPLTDNVPTEDPLTDRGAMGEEAPNSDMTMEAESSFSSPVEDANTDTGFYASENPMPIPTPPVLPPDPATSTWSQPTVNPYTSNQRPPSGGAFISQDEKTMALLAHLLGFFSTILVPLVIYFVKKDQSRFVAFHALQAVYFQIACLIAYAISGVLCLILIGFLMLFVVFVLEVIFVIMAIVAANKGEWYELPIVGAMARKSVGM
jgi:uncharacterized protein